MYVCMYVCVCVCIWIDVCIMYIEKDTTHMHTCIHPRMLYKVRECASVGTRFFLGGGHTMV